MTESVSHLVLINPGPTPAVLAHRMGILFPKRMRFSYGMASLSKLCGGLVTDSLFMGELRVLSEGDSVTDSV